MNIFFYTICVIVFLLIAIVTKLIALKNIKYKKPDILSDKRILTVFYSNGGNTGIIGEYINSVTGGDLKEIKLVENYPNNIFKMSKIVRKQLKDGVLPKIDAVDISNYDVIFVGSPIWNFSLSLPVKAFLKNNNFENKTIIPFITYSGGANKTGIANEIKDLTHANDIKKTLFIFENGIFLRKQQIIKWLNKI